MVCDISTVEKAFKASIARAEKLEKTMLVTKEGEVLSESIARNKKALNLLNEKDFTALGDFARTELTNDMSTVLAKQQLGQVFKAAVSKRPTESTERADYVVKSALITKDIDNIEVIELKVTRKGKENVQTYIFDLDKNESRASKERQIKMYIPQFKSIGPVIASTTLGASRGLRREELATSANSHLAKMRKIVESDISAEDVLKSSEQFDEGTFRYKKSSLKKNYVHGSVEDMKNMLADLHAIGGKPTTDKMYYWYNSLLDNMHEHFFRKMNIFINENQEHAAGWVDIDKDHILLNTSKLTSSKMSNAEVYMHETVHTMTAWALRSKDRKATPLKERLNFLMAQARKNITWQDIKSAEPTLTAKEAKDRYDYIFNSETSNDEFIAYSLTNPGFMKVLEDVKLKDKTKTSLFEAIKEFFSDVINAVMGNYTFSNRNESLRKEVHTLAFKLAEINNTADKELANNPNLLTQVSDLVDRTDGRIEEFLDSVTSRVFDSKNKVKIPENMNHIQKVLFFSKFFAKAVYNNYYRDAAGTFFTSYGIKPNNSIREIIRSILPKVTEEISGPVELLGLKTNNIDLYRNTHVGNVATAITNAFNKELSDFEETALTEILLESNASSLFNKNKNYGKGYSTSQISKLIGDHAYRVKAINRLEKRINKLDPKRGSWLVEQAKGLGNFMVTGEGHEAQNSSSRNIARGYLTSDILPVNKELEALIEEMASLAALEEQKGLNKELVSNLIANEENGVRTVVNLYEAFKQGSEDALFKNDSSHMIEGYVKQLFDDGIETKYALVSEQEELEKQGFKLASVFDGNDISGAEPLGFYISDTYSRPERQSGVIGLGSPGSRGMTLREARYAQFQDSKKHAQAWFEADRNQLNAKAMRINEELYTGKSFKDIPKGAIPVLDALGNVVDYRNMMNKQDKSKFLKQNKSIVDVLSKTSGTLIDKVAREKQNDNALALIKQNLRDVYDNPNSKNNLMEYSLISAESSDPEMRKLFNELPRSFQRFINSRADKSLPIPSLLMDQYFGYSHARFTDMYGVNKLPSTIKRIMNIFEAYFVDLVKVAKGNILLKMPVILVVNIISNVLYALNTGMGLTEIVGAYSDSFKDVRKFMKKQKLSEIKKVELNELVAEYSTTRFKNNEEISGYNDKVTRLRNEIKRIEKEMAESDIKELFDLGMYQAVIEDVNMYKLGDTNKISDGMDKLLSKTPSVIKTPLQWLYLSKETAWYKVNQEVLQMSDLIARDVMNRKQKIIEQQQADGKRDLPLAYRKQINRMGKADRRRELGEAERERFLLMAKASRHTQLLNSFVNYNLPNGKGEEYLNRIGVLMFTKYVKRIQHVITEAGTQHPIRTAITLAGASIGLDLEMIQDQSLLVKAGDDYGVFGLTPIYTPVDILTTVAMPPLINLGMDVFGTK